MAEVLNYSREMLIFLEQIAEILSEGTVTVYAESHL